VGKAKREVTLHKPNEEVIAAVREKTGAELRQAIQNPDKAARESGLTELKNDIVARLLPDFPEQEADLGESVEKVIKEQIRALIIEEKKRPARTGRHPADHLRSGSSAAGPRFGPVYARADPGADGGGVGLDGRRADRGRDRRRLREALHAFL
jgi:polyribonucleotide nucleotidyltransferase